MAASRSPNQVPITSDVYRTDDGGRSWTLLASNVIGTGPIHFTSASSGWGLMPEGWGAASPGLLFTHDGGRTWQRLHPPAPGMDPGLGVEYRALSLFGNDGVLEVDIPTGMLGFAVFDVTHDGGRTWTAKASRRSARTTR